MQYPTIETFSTSQHFRYLWLKYVEGFDLSVHCARCLRGKYSARVNAGTIRAYELRLNEAEARYFYLCGVTSPYCWNDNLHVAFRFKPGAVLTFNEKGTRIIIRNAERIEIKRQESYALSEHGNDPAYNTCRNWRFAYQMTHTNP